MSQEIAKCPAAVITGGACRIGRSIALQLHQDGYCVVIHYRNSIEAAADFVKELNELRDNSAVMCKEDLSYSQSLITSCENIIKTCFDAFGRCDVLINNASAYYPTPLLIENSNNVHMQFNATQIVDIFGSNCIAPFLLIRAFACQQKEDSWKNNNLSIVNISDSMINLPLIGFSMYTMAKHALEGLTKAAAVELASRHIRVNAVAPGLNIFPPEFSSETRDIYREKVPLSHREGSVEEIAKAVAFLVSDNAVYISGTTLKVDGGWSLSRA